MGGGFGGATAAAIDQLLNYSSKTTRTKPTCKPHERRAVTAAGQDIVTAWRHPAPHVVALDAAAHVACHCTDTYNECIPKHMHPKL